MADMYALSPSQQGLLFHSLLEPGAGVYVQQLIGDLHEPMVGSAFQRAWQAVVARHEVLRTSFRWEGLAEPQQSVHERVELPWEFLDWADGDASEREARFTAFLQTDRQRGFELARAPLSRVTVFRFGVADYRFVWTSHHALMDGWSYVPLLREVFARYAAILKGEELRDSPAEPYRTYIEWLARQDHSRSAPYWRQLLAGFTAPTPLTVDHAPGRVDPEEPRRDQIEIKVSAFATNALNTLARDADVTLNTLVQGAWALLLNRYSGEGDVVFGVTRTCRRSTIPGAESMIGLLINTLPLRVQVKREAPLVPWLKGLRLQWCAMRDHEHTPLVQVQGWSELPRGAALFDSMVMFEHSDLDTEARREGGEWLNRHFRLMEQPNYPLSLVAYGGVELSLQISFDRSRFDAATIRRMLGHLEALLVGFATHPNQRLGDLELLTAGERRQMLVEWNDTAADFPEGLCLHQLFEEQVKQTPDTTAVVFEDQQLTFGELNARANQLAHSLRGSGVGPDVLVGLCVERSLEMVVGQLAVLKAGGGYVPIDPAYPAERVAYMLGDAGAAVVLCQKKLAARLPPLAGSQLICLDEIDWHGKVDDFTNPSSGSAAHHLAYVIYTSGSTGRPKGVMISHRAIVNHMRWMQATFPLAVSDCVLQKTPFSFDASVWEFYAPLLAGARLVVARPDGHLDPAYLAATIVERRISILQVVPTMLGVLLDTPQFRGCVSLRRVFCGGEALTGDLVKRFFAISAAELHNLYGPTEVAIDSVAFTPHREDSNRQIPIGRPVANTFAYILDDQQRPVPIGVAGELYLGGAQVGRGYLRQPELTAQRFLPDPFRGGEARMFRTGDRARHRGDGHIEFLGRLDDQVKIRGFRIELGEIETTLKRCPGVRECVVVAREDEPGDKRLVAYVVAAVSQFTPAVAQLREQLKQHLPEHMVPSQFVFVPALPLNPSGKVDRRSLPRPVLIVDPAALGALPPQNLLELELTRVWQRLFQRESIGRDDNFFDLGGHSLLAMRLAVEIEKRVGRRVQIAELFQAPTVAQLARLLRSDDKVAPWSSLVPLQSMGALPPVFCVHGMGGDVYTFLDLARALAPDQPVYGLQAVGLDGRQARHATVEEMAEHYAREIRSIQTTGPYHLLGYSAGGWIAYAVAQELLRQGHEVALLGLVDTQATSHVPSTVLVRYVAEWVRYIAGRVGFRLKQWLIAPPGGRVRFLGRMLKAIPSQVRELWIRITSARRKVTIPDGKSNATRGEPQVDYFEALAARYRPEKYAGNVVLFVSAEAKNYQYVFWEQLVAGRVKVHRVSGSHFTLIDSDHAAEFAGVLRTVLKKP